VTWTKELPATDGHYWWRRDAQDEPETVAVLRGSTVWRIASDDVFTTAELGGEWCGPLVPPSDG
jgi:hypothetical protein